MTKKNIFYRLGCAVGGGMDAATRQQEQQRASNLQPTRKRNSVVHVCYA